MAALVEGHQYGLSSENSTSGQKSVVHVKLTDSALKAFEGFQKIKDVTSRRPTVQFQGSNGIIKVPIAKSSENIEGVNTFHFSLSGIPLDPKGSFECIKQNASGDQSLDMLGSMLHKVAIQATDDSYRTTRERMTQAEEESKKQRAKEIKLNTTGIGRRIKKVIRNPTPIIPSSHSSSIQHPTPQSFKSAPPNRPPVRDDTPRSSHVSRPTTLPNLQKSALSSNHNVANRASGVLNMPLRDRILHLLALRPYKKPELMIRLQKDGMKDRDRNTLGAVLNQVGNFNPRDNNFTLAKHLYPEVRPDWSFYTETDRQLLKRKMNQLHEAGLSTTSPAVSPCHSTGSQGSPNNSQKRMICEEKVSDQPSKKQRVAHGNQKEPADNVSKGSGVSSGGKPVQSSLNPVSPESPGNSNQENNILMEAVSLEDKPDYMCKYHKIIAPDQRSRYKSEFNTEYDEYRQLHSRIESITNKFVDLKDQLQKQSKDTVDYKNIRKRIMCEYKLVKDDTKYMEQRRRHDYLHHKLGYIKKLISDFDNARLGLS